jgi:hypothetical protein
MVLLGLIAICVIKLLSLFYSLYNFWGLFFITLFFFLVYFGLLVVFRVINGEDKIMFRELLSSVKGKFRFS